MDVKLLSILENCNCLDHYKCFKGITLTELSNLKVKDLNTKLTQLLPSVTGRQSLASKIASAIVNYTEDDPGPPREDILNDIKPKLEIISPAAMDTNEDDEIMILDEVQGDVESIVKKENVEVTIDDDGIEHVVRKGGPSTVITSLGVPPIIPSTFVYNQHERKHFWKELWNLPFIPSKETINKLGKDRQNYVLFSGAHMNTLSPAAKRFKVNGHQGSSTCSTSNYTPSQWNSLYIACGNDRITYLGAVHWNWTSPYNDTPDNLFGLLSKHCLNLKELELHSNSLSDSTFTAPLNLPNLKVIRIRQRCRQELIDDTLKCTVLNYRSQLCDIIVATHGNLEAIEFLYLNESSIHVLLGVLRSLTYKELKGLKSILLKQDNPMVIVFTLKHDACEQLSKLSCLELEELHIDFSLHENVKIPFEAMLNRFPKLKKLSVTGCFITEQNKDPKISLTFPAMTELIHLQMGRSEVSAPVIGTIGSRPLKHKEKFVVRSKAVPTLRTQDLRDNGQGRCLLVTLNLPLLPKLKKLTLGRLFGIKELQLQRFPDLTSFRTTSLSYDYDFTAVNFDIGREGSKSMANIRSAPTRK